MLDAFLGLNGSVNPGSSGRCCRTLVRCIEESENVIALPAAAAASVPLLLFFSSPPSRLVGGLRLRLNSFLPVGDRERRSNLEDRFGSGSV